jgi:hypothetical protein
LVVLVVTLFQLLALTRKRPGKTFRVEKGRECGTNSSTGPKLGLGRFEDTDRKRGLDGPVLLAVLIRLLIGAQNLKTKMF